MEETAEAGTVPGNGLDLEPVRVMLQSMSARMEKARQSEMETYQKFLHERQDSESKILALEKELEETKTSKVQVETDLGVEIARLKADNDRLQKIVAKNHQNPKSEKGQGSLQPLNLAPRSRKKDTSYLGMLEYPEGYEAKISQALIRDLNPGIALVYGPGLPADILFMCIRYTDHLNDKNKLRALLSEAITTVKKLIKEKGESDMGVSLLWLSNLVRLLHTLKQYSGDPMFQNDNIPKQKEQSLKNFDLLSEYNPVLILIAVGLYKNVIKLLEDKIRGLIVPAILENDSGKSSKATPARQLLQELDFTIILLEAYGLDPQVSQQVFRQLFYYICAGALNHLLLRRDLCNRSKGKQIRQNISILEEWCVEKKMKPEVFASLRPIIQASQLLQARKTEQDVNSVCEMCDRLKINHVVKLLNLYTPAEEFDEGLPMSFIQQVQNRLEEIRRSSELNQQTGTGSNLLMDTKFLFPVQFPFNPSNIQLETIDIPLAFKISALVKRI